MGLTLRGHCSQSYHGRGRGMGQHRQGRGTGRGGVHGGPAWRRPKRRAQLWTLAWGRGCVRVYHSCGPWPP